jgi:diguanylate cyclase (GGDEF)-like protein/PAS domain S-box-containing protein
VNNFRRALTAPSDTVAQPPNLYLKNRRLALCTCALALVLMAIALSMPPMAIFNSRPADYLSVHLLLEMFAISVSLMIVTIAWNIPDQNVEPIAQAMVFGFVSVAGLDILHTLYFVGMPGLVVDGSINTSLFFWLSSRATEVTVLCLAALQLRLPGSRSFWLVAGIALVVSLLLIAILLPQWLPVSYIPGSGLTPLKSTFEYILCVVNLGLALCFFLRSRKTQSSRDLWLSVACFITAMGALAFAQYRTPSEFINLFGHFYKVAAYCFLYLAAFQIAVRKPYRLLEVREQRIREQETELHNLLSNLPVGVARLDESLHLRYANPTLIRSLDRRPQSVIGQTITDLLLTDVAEQIKPHLFKALEGVRSDLDLEYVRPDGNSAFASCLVVPERQVSGREAGVLVIFTDTSERERNRQKLMDSLRENAEIKAALDAHAIVAITDNRGVITQVNDKFCAISQYARSELIGRTHSLINSGHHPREFFQDLWRTISHGEVWSGEVCNRTKDGSLYWVQSTIMPFIGKDGLPEQYIAIRADITKRKRIEEAAQRMALHDALTGLANRRLMSERLIRALHNSQRDHQHGALLLMDMDHFKEINDTLGHPVGDQLLKEVAARLQGTLRQGDTVARLGGDEFVVILEGLGNSQKSAMNYASDTGEKIRQVLSAAYNLHGHLAHITPSIGVVLFDGTLQNTDELIKQADIALYKAKNAGRDQLRFFDNTLQSEINQRALLLRDLRLALEQDELRLLYQPVVATDEQILGFEALLRWQNPQLGLVSPAQFIPLAEESGLIIMIGQWVLSTACRQLAEWQQDPVRQTWTIAVNISARQLSQNNFVQQVLQVLASTCAPANRLRLEITESMLQHDLTVTIEKMEALRQIGVRFSLDDFGTGYSSMSYLKQMPLDQLKIDKSFVDEILTDSTDRAIARTVVTLAEYLGLEVVAEGVEERAQKELLVSIGCRAFQGYLFGKPAPLA